MYRFLPYTLLFVITLFLQIFLFDNLSISIFFNPLIYIAFILLLPLNTSPITLLGLGLLMGLTMDWVMGIEGLNTLTTLPLAFLRPRLTGLFCNRDDEREGGVPSVEKFGSRKFFEYLLLGVVSHHTLFFFFESLSWDHVFHTVVRIVISSTATIGFIWLIAYLFTVKYSAR